MGYSKLFAGSVTDYAHKYRFDPFFRTEINIIVLQFVFATFLLTVLYVIAGQLYHDASAAVLQGIADALAPESTPTTIGTSVIAELDYTRSRTLLYAVGSIIAITGIFTYMITRLALSPTRNALESQKQFIGNVAHELRTPLAVSKTNIEVALMGASVEKEMRETLDSTVEELDRISEIINNLLSLSASIRPERMEFKDVDLGAVVRTVSEKLRGLSEPKELVIEIRTSERRTVWGNPAALEQIVMNIMKNAVLYTSRHGNVLITIEPVYPDFMELTVRDSGTGIARKDLFRIFEPYYRADPSRKRVSGGSGLGLTIVSELVKLHGGKIAVRSAEKRGTTVTILLPAGTQPVGTEIKNIGDDKVSEIAVDYSHGKPRGV